MNKILLSMLTAVGLLSCSAKADNASSSQPSQEPEQKPMATQTAPAAGPDSTVLITTSLGDIEVRLFGDTPKHQANFLKLVREGYYNGTLFHRVINEFMVQAGDPDSKTAKPGQQLGQGGPGYQIDAEIVYPKHFHKRGALAAARTADQVNPERKSSGSQFYIVTGKSYTPAQIEQLEAQMKNQEVERVFYELASQHRAEIMQMQQAGDQEGLRNLQDKLVTEAEAKAGAPKMTEEQIKAYTTEGGTPFLDNQYTVFGEVVKGMDVVEKIEKAQTGAADRPAEDIKILSMKVL